MLKSIPFDFVFDYLPESIVTKKMFGMHYIYWGKKIMLILRSRGNEPDLNGVWVATGKAHHESLKTEIPELGPFFINHNERHGNWLLIQEDADGFEEAAIKVCGMISHGDTRIGKATEKPPLWYGDYADYKKITPIGGKMITPIEGGLVIFAV